MWCGVRPYAAEQACRGSVEGSCRVGWDLWDRQARQGWVEQGWDWIAAFAGVLCHMNCDVSCDICSRQVHLPRQSITATGHISGGAFSLIKVHRNKDPQQ